MEFATMLPRSGVTSKVSIVTGTNSIETIKHTHLGPGKTKSSLKINKNDLD
jgi:hypothetical protein